MATSSNLLIRQAGEPHLWWTRCQRFCQLGPGRTLLATCNAELLAADKPPREKLPHSWSSAAVRWNWIDRAAAHDLALHGREREQFEQGRLQAAQTQIRLLQAYQAKLAGALQTLTADSARWGDLAAGMRLTGDQLAEQFGLAVEQWEVLHGPTIADDDARARQVTHVLRAARHDWRASAWLLERRWWRDFARRGPETISPERISHLLSQTVAYLLTEVPVEFHARIQERLAELAAKEVQPQLLDSEDESES